MSVTLIGGSIQRRRGRRAAAFGILLAGVACLAAAPPYREFMFNPTASMPVGLYELRQVDRAVGRGDEVVVCAPERFARLALARGYLPTGACAAGTAPLLKLVAGIAGDVADVRGETLAVNGRCLSSGKTFIRDGTGRAIPHVPRLRRRLGPHELWLWAPAARSLDSRYFGSVMERDVRSFAAPLLVRPRERAQLVYVPCRTHGRTSAAITR